MYEAVGDDERRQRQTLRQSLRAQRAAMSLAESRAASARVCAALSSLPSLLRARVVALYAAIDNEIDLAELRAWLHARSIRVAYPRILSRADHTLAFHEVAVDETLLPAEFAIPSPPDVGALEPDAIDVILVPAIGFSRDGHRLGFGHGYYDATLATHPRALRIGAAHEFQLVDSFTTTPAISRSISFKPRGRAS